VGHSLSTHDNLVGEVDMSLARSEREQIRINIERIDHRLGEAQDFQEAVHAVARQQQLEQLSLASQIVVSQEMVDYQLANVNTGLGGLGTVITDLSQGIDALGSMFQWGFDEIICQLELIRDDLREILKTLRRPLETQAKELCKRGFQALSNGWYDEALEDLSASAEYDYRDFTVHRALGTIHVREDRWKAARSAFEKAAKYAGPYSPHIAAECELEASVACRQLSDFEAAYEHTEAALGLHNDSLIAHYEHAVNAVCLSGSESLHSDDLKAEALARLRYLLWKDDLYAARVDTDSYFESIRSQCSRLLEELRSELQNTADTCLKSVDVSLRTLELFRTREQLALLAPKSIEGRQRLQALRDRASIYDLREVRLRTTAVREEIHAARDFINRVDGRVRNMLRLYRVVEMAVPPKDWPDIAGQFDTVIQEIERLHVSNSRTAYEHLDARAPAVESDLYRLLEKRLLGARNTLMSRLDQARKLAENDRQRLRDEIKSLEEKVRDPGGEWLGYLLVLIYVCVVIILWRMVHPGLGMAVLLKPPCEHTTEACETQNCSPILRLTLSRIARIPRT
jgi:tetratricopeptide (TPR) repeat protein